MEEQNESGWNVVSSKSKKPKSKFYKLDGTCLTSDEIKLTKELQKEHQLNKKNKGRKKKETDSQMVLNKTTIYANDDMEDPIEHGYRLLTKEDTTLTPEETEQVTASGHKLFCCLCCDDTSLISNIIGRQVYSCGTCYCCIGDDPYGDICTVYVNDETRTLYKEDYEKRTGEKYINSHM